MINNSLIQLIVGGGVLTAAAATLYSAGKIVSTVEHLSRTVEGMQLDLKDVQSKVTVLWEQRKIV